MTPISHWDKLGAAHRQSIEQFGINTFKRHINFQYGQWAVQRYRNRFTMRLLAALLSRGRLPRSATTIKWNEAHGIRWPGSYSGSAHHKMRAYAFYCGLLWQYAELYDQLGCLKLPEPMIGSPLPVYRSGRLISQDLAMASLDLNLIASIVPRTRLAHARILEIGAGYGRLAYAFRSLFPSVHYTIADVEPALTVSQTYLEKLFPGNNIQFRQPDDVPKLPANLFDLVVNVSSFDEMPYAVSQGYIQQINRICRGYVYLSGYAKACHDGCLGLDELQYPPSWRALYDQSHEIFPGWVEKVFRIS